MDFNSPVRHHLVTRLGAAAAALMAVASLHAQTPVKTVPVAQIGLTAVNSNDSALYNVTVTPDTSDPGALITGTTVLNTDAAPRDSFFAVARVPNSVTSAMDLIVADAASNRILRYPGPGPASYAVSTPIFTWSKIAAGPKYPIALAADVAGNLFAATAGPPFDNAGLWVLPFNAATGAYGAPILVDNTCGLITEVLVATSSATPVGGAAPAWNAGDVLILVNDIFNPRVLVYSQASIAGLLANPGHELGNPSSTAVASSLLHGTLPTGMDIWPADAAHGVSLLLTTVDGRIMRFDSGSGAMAADFASGLGLGLQRIKVGTYSTLTYAFVSQFAQARGKILQFGAPPASGANLPLASLSTGNKDPQGLAVSSSGSVPATACVASDVTSPGCAPLGAQLTTRLSGPGSGNLPPAAPLLEESCVVKSDPRVKVSLVAPTSWACDGTELDVADYCHGFPHTVLPGTMCGHSGPTGSGFVVIKSTAKAVDGSANNSFFQHTVNPDLPLPGPLNLACPQMQVFAWAPRSDLPLIEGITDEGGPASGGNYFLDLTGFCDNGGGTSHVLSMMAYGLGVNSDPSGMPNGPPGFVTDKFTHLTHTISAASAQISDPTVAATVQGYVDQAQSFFKGGLDESASNGFSCALNSLASGDAYVHANLPAFSGLAPTSTSPTNNLNPAVDIDGRLANLFLVIDRFFPNLPPNAEWPTNNVPPCVSLTPTPASVIVSFGSPLPTATLSWGPATTKYLLSFPPSQCSISSSDSTFPLAPATVPGPSGSAQTGPLTTPGSYPVQLMCTAGAGNSITSFTQAMVNVIALQSISVTPQALVVAAGGTTQLSATGTYTDGTTIDLTSTLSSDATGVATVSAGVVSCSRTAAVGGTAHISATGATATGTTTGSTTVTCLAPLLTIAPTQLTLPAGGTKQLTATDTYSDGSTIDVTATVPATVKWSSDSTAATVSPVGVVTCANAISGGSANITATSGGGSNTSNTVTVTCLAAVLKSISVTPSLGEIPHGGTRQLQAIGTYIGGATANLTATATWSSSTSAATVSAGLVTCKASRQDGLAIISASVGSFKGSTNIVCDGIDND